MIQATYDADCDECWVYYADGQVFVDKDEMVTMMKLDGWVVNNEGLCWCPDHVDKAE
jgi:hypothetical protein